MEAMETLIRKGGRPALVDAEGNRTELPDAIYEMMVHLIHSMKQGRSIIMMPEDETFTTQAAANFLGISRQYLVDLLEDDKIPFHKVGSHRRVYFRDLKEYADQRDSKRRKTLDDLFDKVTEADKYDAGYTGDEHLKKWGVKAVHPQDYLLILYSMRPAVFMTKLSRIAQKRDEDMETVVMNFGRLLEDIK